MIVFWTWTGKDLLVRFGVLEKFQARVYKEASVPLGRRELVFRLVGIAFRSDLIRAFFLC